MMADRATRCFKEADDDSPAIEHGAIGEEKQDAECARLIPSRLRLSNSPKSPKSDDDKATKNPEDDIPEEELETPRPPTPEETFESLTLACGVSPIDLARQPSMAPARMTQAGDDEIMGDCERLFVASGNCMKTSFAMSLGLKDVKGRFIDNLEDDDFHKEMTNKAHIAPTVEILRKEMKRHAHKAELTKFQKNSCLKPECLKWLKMNPVTDFRDIVFLR